MKMESTPAHLTMTYIFAILGALLSIPLQLVLSRKLGRKATMTYFLAVLSSVFLVSTFVPFAEAPSAIFIVAVFIGVCLTLPNVIPVPRPAAQTPHW